jgi:hypothetical protein
MARLSAAIIVIVFAVSILGVSGAGKAIEKRDIFEILTWDQFFNEYCINNTDPFLTFVCNIFATTTSTPTSTTGQQQTSIMDSNPVQTSATTAGNIQTTSTSASTLEPNPWCRLSNGTSIPLGYTFMYTECTLCQCLKSHSIGCTVLQCMPTYCIDGSTPSRRAGQCCAQCAYEKSSNSCVIGSVSFPDGTILQQTANNIECWCQLGTVECRKATGSLFSGLDLWGQGTAVYVIVIIICVLILLGTLLCCTCTIFFYYYYQRNQQAVQQSYAEYYNNAGWQPMPDEGGEVVDANAEEKQAEAEQNQYEQEYPTDYPEEYIPPPYALHNGSFVNEQKDEKYI